MTDKPTQKQLGDRELARIRLVDPYMEHATDENWLARNLIYPQASAAQRADDARDDMTLTPNPYNETTQPMEHEAWCRGYYGQRADTIARKKMEAIAQSPEHADYMMKNFSDDFAPQEA